MPRSGTVGAGAIGLTGGEAIGVGIVLGTDITIGQAPGIGIGARIDDGSLPFHGLIIR